MTLLRKKWPVGTANARAKKKVKSATNVTGAQDLHQCWKPAQDRLSVADEVTCMEGATLAQVCLKLAIPSIRLIESSTTEHLMVTSEQRASVEEANKDLGILLPMSFITKMTEYYPESAGDDALQEGLSTALELRCSSVPTARFTQPALMTMLDGHRLNDDIRLAQDMFLWLEGMSRSNHQFPLGLGSVLSLAAPVAAIAGQVGDWLGASRASMYGWRFFDVAAGASGDVAGCRAYGGHTTSYPELARGCQAAWVTSKVIKAALIELRVAMRATKSYIVLSSEAASMLRIGSVAVSHADAQKAVKEVASEAGDSDKLVLVINLLDEHWVSAVADISNRSIMVYDSLVGIQSAEKALAVQRLEMLCNAVAAQRPAAASSGPQASSVPWGISECSVPAQRDSYSCGAFALAHVICALNRTRLPVDATGDVLRLDLMHNLLSRGRVYEHARSTFRLVTPAS